MIFRRFGWRRSDLWGQVIRSFFKIFEERSERYPQGTAYFNDILKAQIAFTTLNRSHERPVHAALISKCFLRVSAFGTQFPNSLPKSSQKKTRICIIHTFECRDVVLFTSTVFA